MIPLAVWLIRAGFTGWLVSLGLSKVKEATYEGAILNALNNTYALEDGKLWYVRWGLSENQALRIIERIRYYVINNILPFPSDGDKMLAMARAIAADMHISRDSLPYKGVLNVVVGVSKDITPETSTPTTSKGTLYNYIRGGITAADKIAALPAQAASAALDPIRKADELLPWYLRPSTLLIFGGVILFSYYFGPTIRRALNK